MARYPGAIWKPITAKTRSRLTVYNRMNLHVAVSEGDSLFSFFNQPGIADSHFYVRRDGTVEQYVDTAYRAYADLEGNDATISVETQGMGTGGWTPAQRESLARLYAWAVKTHGIAKKLATNSKVGTSSHGLSWHRLGCDGNFPALPSILAGRLQRGGGMHYSRSYGKICPGDDRIKQIPSIFARALEILGGSPTTTTTTTGGFMADLTEAQQQEIHKAVTAKVRDGDRWLEPHDAERVAIILLRRNAASLTALTAAVKVLATSIGVDGDAVIAAVREEVRAALPDTITVNLGE